MRHRVKTVKLGRKSEHKEALLSNLAASLIRHNRVKTTLIKAKALRPFAEKLVTLGKKGTLHHRRLAIARLDGKVEETRTLFDKIAPRFAERAGGYTRIYKLGPRNSDAAPMALIEWVEGVQVEPTPPAETPATSSEATPKKAAKKSAKPAAK
ncbi:MAG: 50S ribosomal protein L17 [Bdellovibrionaceae bacterium]|nr:50S ribosomal protein L17 [Pseudobdellovibrionaceae bacterium]